MAHPKPRPKQALPSAPSGLSQAMGSLWRLFFAVDLRPPRNFYERRRRRFRASFFFLLGVAATLAVQAALGKSPSRSLVL